MKAQPTPAVKAHELLESFMIQLIANLPISVVHSTKLKAAKNMAIHLCNEMIKSIKTQSNAFEVTYWEAVIVQIRKL